MKPNIILNDLYNNYKHGLKIFNDTLQENNIDIKKLFYLSNSQLLPYIIQFLFKKNICIFFDNDCYYVKSINSNNHCILAKLIGESLSITIPELNQTMNNLYLSNLYDTITNAYMATFKIVIELYHNDSITDKTIIIDDTDLPF